MQIYGCPQVRVGYVFVFRSLMQSHTALVLGALIVTVWLVASWAVHVCDASGDTATRSFVNSFWLVIISFLVVCSLVTLNSLIDVL